MNPREMAVDEFLQRLKDKFKDRIEGVYLFGSYVRGDYLDVIVEPPEQFEKWKESSFHRTVLSEGIKVY